MSWTTSSNLRDQLMRYWNKGALLRELSDGPTLFPLRLTLRKPSAKELSDNFSKVHEWISRLTANEKYYRIDWVTKNHRVMGRNALPNAIWVDSLDDALAFIGKTKDAGLFLAMLSAAANKIPELKSWLSKRPLKAIELADDWGLISDVITWMKNNPRPEIYLRQVDIPGVHSKFIEARKKVLAELADIVLEPSIISADATGVTGFCRRYGFKDKPIHIRFRILDASYSLFSGATDQPISVTKEVFSALFPPLDYIFITENETNFLSFPSVPNSMVIFGSGYGFDSLYPANWLHEKQIFYWGDIDTHGFAILDQLRAHFPHVESILMDHSTMMSHKEFWGTEEKPELKNLNRLTPEENGMYSGLQSNIWAKNLRLEQERIGFSYLTRAVFGSLTNQAIE
jgi:hypothetical protein